MSGSSGSSAARPSTSPPTRRVVDTLRALAHGPLGHGEVARRVGMTPATATAVLAELVACGWVERDATSRLYRLGAELVSWAAPLGRADHRIRDAVRVLATSTGLPVLFGRVRRDAGRAPVLLVEDTSAFLRGRGEWAPPSVEMPFAAPFGSVVAAHAPAELRAAWLPADPGLARLFEARLEQVVADGFSVEAYGPHIVQLLSLLSTSADDLGRDRAARLTEDLQQMIASGDHDLAAKYPSLVSVPVALADGTAGSLTVQLRHTDDDPAGVLPLLRPAAAALERDLRGA